MDNQLTRSYIKDHQRLFIELMQGPVARASTENAMFIYDQYDYSRNCWDCYDSQYRRIAYELLAMVPLVKTHAAHKRHAIHYARKFIQDNPNMEDVAQLMHAHRKFSQKL